MKKFLPLSDPEFIEEESKGFTLIELLVVITIIAILAVTGFVVYSGVSARGRDAKRIAEIDAIHKAMEKNYQPGAVNPYPVLSATDFANNVIPTDPVGSASGCSGAPCKYCSKATKAACAADPADPVVSITAPPAGSSYTVCANLETRAGVGGATFYCKSNAQ